MKYTEEEYKRAEIAFKGRLESYENAINISKKYLNDFKDKPEYELDIKLINIGLEVLEKGYEAIKGRGVEGVIKKLRQYPIPGKRPGLGLTMGYGEILAAHLHKPWFKEIYQAARDIEMYFGYM